MLHIYSIERMSLFWLVGLNDTSHSLGRSSLSVVVGQENFLPNGLTHFFSTDDKFYAENFTYNENGVFKTAEVDLQIS